MHATPTASNHHDVADRQRQSDERGDPEGDQRGALDRPRAGHAGRDEAHRTDPRGRRFP